MDEKAVACTCRSLTVRAKGHRARAPGRGNELESLPWRWPGRKQRTMAGSSRASVGLSGPRWASAGLSGHRRTRQASVGIGRPGGPRWASAGLSGPRWASVGLSGHRRTQRASVGPGGRGQCQEASEKTRPTRCFREMQPQGPQLGGPMRPRGRKGAHGEVGRRGERKARGRGKLLGPSVL